MCTNKWDVVGVEYVPIMGPHTIEGTHAVEAQEGNLIGLNLAFLPITNQLVESSGLEFHLH